MSEEQPPPAQEPEAAAAASGENGEKPPEKPKRGKPKDPNAPPKPKNAFQIKSAEARAKLKAERPELATDLKAMGLALKEEWEKVPQEEKDRLQEIYEKEMEVWRPKWAAYKETKEYKVFFEIKQDWVDGRQMKKLQKKARKEAPPRPKSGYMIFAGEVRGRVGEEVKAAGGGLADIGKKIAEEWAAISEAKKGEYDAQSAKMKEKWLPEYAEYKKSDLYKNFVKDKAMLENKQIQKKLVRTKLAEAPKKAANAMSIWRSEVAPTMQEELKGKSMSERAKIYAEHWAKVPAEQKEEYSKKAQSLKKDYDEKKETFKTKKSYLDFLLERRKAKEKENKVVKLIDMPKRPKSVFAMFSEVHAKEVEPGKGEGKGRHALKMKFAQAPAEEKEELAKKEAEAKAKFQEELNQFKESETYKGFLNTNKKIKTEFMNEAMKVMTLKFLRHSPAAPPKTAFAVYLGEKRKAEAEADGEPKSKKEKSAEVNKYRTEFMKLDRTTKKEYDATRVEKYKAWQAEVKEYMEKPFWQEYLTEAKKLKVPIKSLLAQKSKVIKKLKNGMRFIPLPEKPPDMPSKPKQAYALFMAAKKGTMELSEMAEAWNNLEGEEKQKFIEEAAQLQREYETNMRVFKESDEGKMYLKEVQITARRRRTNLAKFKFLGNLPKKPVDPKVGWMKANMQKIKLEFPLLKGPELKAKLEERFRDMSEEEKEKLNEERKAGRDAYEQSLREFKAGEDWQKYTKAVKAKAKAKAASTVPVPEDMPQRPLEAVKLFRKEQAGKSLQEQMKLWSELPQEEKDRRIKEAQEAMQKYSEDLAAWGKTDTGKKYNKLVASREKANKLAAAKSRYLQNEPKKPSTGMQLWANEIGRAAAQKEFPEVKGLGLVPKIGKLWTELSAEDKQPWLDKEKEAQEEYQTKFAEWKATPEAKRYDAIVKKLTGKGVKKAAKAGKGAGKKSKPGVAMPEKPEGLPKKPLTGYFLFLEEKRAAGAGANKNQMNADWIALGAEGQKKYNDESKEKFAQFDKDMRAFMKTAEGKKYNRLKNSADKKQKIENAKKKFLSSAEAPAKPKVPQTAYFLFCNDKRPSLGSGSLKEVAAKVTAMWNEIDAEEKKIWEDKATVLRETYQKELAEYKNHPLVQKFDKAVRSAAKAKPKPKARAAPERGKGKAAQGAGRGRGGGRGRGAAAAASKPDAASSDSDVMGSDSDSSSNDSDSD